MHEKANSIRKQILDLVTEYHQEAFAAKEFTPGLSSVPVSGKVFDEQELRLLVDSSLDFWLTTGRFAEQFEKQFAKFFGIRKAALTNSGSSANLLALSALTSETLGEDRLKPGEEVITVAAGFPTTVNPIIQNNLVPVFLDVEIPTYNILTAQLEQALTEKTGAVMLAHTLGNPFDLAQVTDFVKRHNLWLIEDCCDAVGSTFNNKMVGTFGDLATTSFYPAHHITMGEGGCVLTNQPALVKLVESFRDWGRDCWCAPGKENTCGKRFEWRLGDMPFGFDHKYLYSHIGYNLKATDMQAAVGVAQLEKLPAFIEKRKRNFQFLYSALKPLEEFLILPEPTPGSSPSWFGFPIGIRTGAPISRRAVIEELTNRKVMTRLLFGGNLIKQSAYKNVRHRVVGTLENTDFVATQVFWLGVYPGLTEQMLSFVAESLTDIFRKA